MSLVWPSISNSDLAAAVPIPIPYREDCKVVNPVPTLIFPVVTIPARILPPESCMSIDVAVRIPLTVKLFALIRSAKFASPLTFIEMPANPIEPTSRLTLGVVVPIPTKSSAAL